MLATINPTSWLLPPAASANWHPFFDGHVESIDSESSASTILVQHPKYLVRHTQHKTFLTMFAPGHVWGVFPVQNLVGHPLAPWATFGTIPTKSCRGLLYYGHEDKHRLFIPIIGIAMRRERSHQVISRDGWLFARWSANHVRTRFARWSRWAILMNAPPTSIHRRSPCTLVSYQPGGGLWGCR